MLFYDNRKIIKNNNSPQCWKEKSNIVRIYLSDLKNHVESLKFICESCEIRTNKLYNGIKCENGIHIRDKICSVCYKRRLTNKNSLQRKLDYNLLGPIIEEDKLFDSDNIKEVKINKREKLCLINGLLQLDLPVLFNNLYLDENTKDEDFTFINSTKSYNINHL